MERNIGTLDANLRWLLGIGVLILAVLLGTRPFLSLGATLIGLLLIGTAAIRVCPLYGLLGLNTRR
jgi:Protein of unknown function (DUF2892)